jgi:hypothetical protein
LRERPQAQTFDLARKVNYWRWRFQIRERRAGRVPNGHFCCAIRLVQDAGGVGAEADAASAVLYAFVPPEQAEALKGRYPFYELRRSKDMAAGSSGSSAPGALGGRDATFLAAEKARWEAGAELEAADFEPLMDYLAAYLPDFSAAPTS